MSIPQIIYEQIGGGKFVAMTGAGPFVATGKPEPNALEFAFKGFHKANKCKITLTPMDLYDMTFYKFSPSKFTCPEVKTFEGIYFDQLQATFTSFTGLDTTIS